jgi:alkylation response protein AidB-like acyl-CoA dehydrogenase
MALAITDDHKALADVVRDFAESNGLRALTRLSLETAAGLGPAWKQIAELGWLGLHLPEEYGGSGFGSLRWRSWRRVWAPLRPRGRSCRPSPPRP